ncbi:MAG: DNA polymerase I [Anaerosomatales bacterium]|nr:DNA polymerase I [Anaerosomatales bacterium]MDT8434502.1 DNA polymerase I [Anaerosomatales bacterium]
MTSRTVAAIDGNSLLHRAFHALPPTMTAPDGRPTNAAFGFISMLVKLVQELHPDGVVVAFDRGKPAFRTEALACYKIHRPPTASELKVQFPIVKELLDALGIPILEVEGWEGDDILGTIARLSEESGIRALLVTGDRDALQLVTDTVHVVSTRKGITDIVIYDPAAVLERYGVTPAQVTDYLGLKGDTSDNIPGVPGVGEKTAAKLIAEYGSLDAVLDAAPGIKGKLGENLAAHAEDARVSRTVATIRTDVPIDVDLTAVSWGGFDPTRVAEAFGKLRFTSLLDRVLVTDGLEQPGDAAQSPVTDTVMEWSVIQGPAALERLGGWATRQQWLGVALDDGTTESLFAVRRDLAVACVDEVAVVGGEDTPKAFAKLLADARLAAGDTKALLHELCPPVSDGRCDLSFDAADPARLFDCALAAYLLESNRSAYTLDALAADYLGAPLPEPTEERGRAALEARAAAALAPVLEGRLAEDGSTECFERIEMPLVPVLARMERVGVGVDTGVLAGLAEETRGRITELRERIFAEADTEFNIDSPKQLGEVLFDKMGLPRSKRTKTGYSTDASVLSSLAADFPIAQMIMDYRELAKLTSTYLEALPRLIAEDGRLHTTFNQTVAATGRLSSSNPNLQNIPVRTEFGRRIRAAFVPAEPGHLMVGVDYSQIELRILAHLSGDEGLIEAFTSGEDFHAATAARVFGVAVDSVTPGYRSRAKAVNFGIVYGQSAHGLADTLKIGRVEAQAMIDRYYAAYPRVRSYLDETVAEAHRTGVAITMFGRKRRIPELKSSNYNLRSFGERTAMNHPMQGTAADIMKLAMIEVDRRLREEGFASRLVLQVHDELVFEAPPAEVERLSTLAREAMSGVADLSVPLLVDVSSGPNWAAAK